MKIRSILILLLVIWFNTADAIGNTGSITGTVKSIEGEPLQGASVVLIGTKIGTATNSKGNFLITNIVHGVYNIRISMIGFKPVVYENIDIRPGSIMSISIEMQLSQLDLEEVVVEASAPIIRRDITGTLHNVGRERIENSPISTLEEIAGLQVGVTRDGYIRGGRRKEVLYLIDGLPVNDLISGGLGSEIPKSSIEQYSLQTGGMEAEFGDALSGVVNITTVTSKEKTIRSFRLKSDSFHGGTERSNEIEGEFSLSGPLSRSKLSYLITSSFNMSDSRWWQDMTLYFNSPINTSASFLSKLVYEVSENKSLSLQGLYALRNWRDYEFSWRFNLDGLPKRSRKSLRTAIFWNHKLSQQTQYSASISRYRINSRIGEGNREDISPEPWQYDFLLRYVTSGSRNWWGLIDQENYNFKLDFQSKLFERHLFKTGANLNFFDINSDVVKLEPRMTYFGKPIIDQDLLNYSNRYHYKPRSGSFYIQDKIVSGFDGSTVSLGVRIDFLDPRALRPSIEYVPIGEDEYREDIIDLVPAEIKFSISPRLGFSAPITDRMIMFLSFGQYFQNPLFEQLYSGLSNVQFRFGNSVLRGNPDLEPETTRAIEISFRYRINTETSVSAIYYQKETTNQIDTKTFLPSNSRIAGDYGFAQFVNSPLAQSSGIEFMLSRKSGDWVNGNISYVLSKAKGLSQDEGQGLNYEQWGFEVPKQLYFMSWDQRHTFKGDIIINPTGKLLISLFWELHTGRPYTFYPSDDRSAPVDIEIPFVPNNRRLPGSGVMDIQISREIYTSHKNGSISGQKIRIYFASKNILDAKNVRWVDSSGNIGGELSDPSAYDVGRRSFIGLILDF